MRERRNMHLCRSRARSSAAQRATCRELRNTGDMSSNPLEDHRGVDLWQIRERLLLTPAERLARLVHEVEVFNEIRDHAARAAR